MLPRFLLAAAVSVVLCHQSIGQEIPFAAIAESNFGAEQESIGELIELQVVNGKLGLLRRWGLKIDRENVDETDESLLEAAIQKNVDRGMHEEFARRRAEQRLTKKHPAANFMGRIHSNLRGTGSGSSGGRDGAKRYDFRGGEYTMTMRIDGEYLKMKLSEETANGLEIQFVESPQDGLFWFRYSSLDTIVNFSQSKGVAKFSYCVGGEAKVLTGKNYDDLLESHPAAMNAYLIELWQELGVLEPISLGKPEVMKVAIEVLQSIQEDEMKVFGLMESLGSDSLAARDEAASELTAGFYKWKHWIDVFEDRFEYDKISKEYFGKVCKGSPCTMAQDYANSIDFKDAKKLVRILELADDEQKSIVVQQLRSVTDEKLTDLVDWKEHLSIEP